jgi:polar amino acid transport system substrate-binding protein
LESTASIPDEIVTIVHIFPYYYNTNLSFEEGFLMMSYRLAWSDKRFPSLMLSVLVALSLLSTACGSTPETQAGNGSMSTTRVTITPPTDLLTPGVLTVGSDTTYPPQEFIDTGNKQAMGFDIDLITQIADLMGLKVNVVSTDFTTLIDSLSNKRFDVVISAVTVNPDRQKKISFVNYFSAGESLLVQQGNPMHLKSASDLCGLNVGVQKATVEQDDLTAASKDCTVRGKLPIHLTVLENQTDVVALLANKRVVATYQDSPVTDYYIKQHPGEFTVGGSIANAAPEGIAVRKGDTSMLIAMQTAFDVLKINGTYHRLILKWGLANEELS